LRKGYKNAKVYVESGSYMKKAFFTEELYKQKSVNDLILFAIYSVSTRKEKCTFEKLMKECFTLFPRAFCFSQYKKWPDSRKLDRPLRALRDKKLIKGDPKNYFSLTKNGKKSAEEIARTLKQTKLKFK